MSSVGLAENPVASLASDLPYANWAERLVGNEANNHSRDNEGRQRQEHTCKLPRGSLASLWPAFYHHRCGSPTFDCPPGGARAGAGGVTVVEDASDEAWKTAQKLAATGCPIIIDTPGFRSPATLACIAAADFLLVPVKASPLDIDRMLDTLNTLIDGAGARRPTFRCVLTQTTRDSVIAKHIRAELIEAGFQVLKSEMTNRVVYAEAALWGATPSLIENSAPPRGRSPQSPMKSMRSSVSSRRRDNE